MRRRIIKIRVNERLTITVGRTVRTDIPLTDLQNPQIRQAILNDIINLIYSKEK